MRDTGAQIRYTLAGSEPVLFDPAIVSGTSIVIIRNLTVKAKAWVGSEASPTTTATYTLIGDIVAGGDHSLALGIDGKIWGWGNKGSGRLATGSTASGNILAPVRSRYSNSSTIDNGGVLGAGKHHSVILDSSGNAWAFGNNVAGELGDTTTTDQAYAVRVRKSSTYSDYLTGCVAVAGGGGFSGALAATGEVYVWGNKELGRLGNGTTSGNRQWAGMVQRGDIGTFPTLGGIDRITLAEASAFAKEPCAMQVAGGLGRVWAWGSNDAGQLGQGNLTDLTRAFPMKLNSTTEITDAWDVSSGNDHVAILRWKVGDPDLQGSVWSAGQQQYGRLGSGSTGAATLSYPVKAMKSVSVPLDGIVSVAAGSAHTLALDGDGNVWAWGYNYYGALGNNSTTDSGYAVKVKNPAGTGDLQDIVRIAA